MRRIKILLILVLMLTLVSGTWLYWYATQPLNMGVLPKTFSITPGTSLHGLAVQLQKSRIVKLPFAFRLVGRLLNKSTGLKAGVYEIKHPLSPLALYEKIERGDVTQSAVQFIEGWNIREVRAALRQQESLVHASETMSDDKLLAAIGASEAHVEGLFFPDTYFFSPRSTDIEILRRAYRAQRDKLNTEWQDRAADLPYRTPYEALIMASIIEKETGVELERPRIAAVFINRLKLGMRLQTDPTVIYGLGARFDGNLRKADLQQDTPYNTYAHTGLPPTPIAMPGTAAVHAALHPATTDALYFVSRGNGTHVFSSSLEAHNRAVNRYQR
jgi:UPF0755 protein